MKLNLTGSGLLAAAGLVVGGYLLMRGFAAGRGAAKAVWETIDQAGANVQSTWQNNIASPWQRGQDFMAGTEPVVSSKAWLYSDYAYTGIDQATGKPITEGEWYSDAVARRYDAEQRAAGTPPAATSINGAAFGIYPKP